MQTQNKKLQIELKQNLYEILDLGTCQQLIVYVATNQR